MALLVSRRVAAPLATVWDVLVDTHQWPRWGPSVRAVQCAEQHIFEHSCGRLQTAVGIWVPFRITAFDEQRYWRWQVGGVPATGHQLRALADGRTELVFEVPWAAAPYGAVCRAAARRIALLSEKSADGDVRGQ